MPGENLLENGHCKTKILIFIFNKKPFSGIIFHLFLKAMTSPVVAISFLFSVCIKQKGCFLRIKT